jgi:hypothetical protein
MASKQTIDGCVMPPPIPYTGETLSIFGVVYNME